MAEDTESWRARQATLDGPSDDIDFRADHLLALSTDVDYPAVDLAMTREQFHRWEHDKVKSLTGHRDKSVTSPCTGTTSAVHHTPWWIEFDDSMTTYTAMVATPLTSA